MPARKIISFYVDEETKARLDQAKEYFHAKSQQQLLEGIVLDYLDMMDKEKANAQLDNSA